MRRITLALLIALVGLGGYLLGAARPAPSLLAQTTEQCFPETGKCIRGAFLTYWRANGALRQQGLPISDEFQETQAPPPAGDGKTYTVQYFERSRFELHPEFAGTPNEVLLGLLGSEQYRAKYPSGPPTGSPAPPPPAPAPPPAVPPPPPTGEAAPQRMTGTGQQVTPRFALQAGLSVIRLTHSGRANFITTLLDANGQRVDGLTNVIGPFDGATPVGIERAGDYLINVQADGAWTIVVEQPRPTSAPPPPQTFTGRGQQVSPFFQLNGGLVTFRLRHGGQANFIVTLLDKDGRRSEGLVNEIGAFDGSKAVGGKTGIFLLEIQADGDWTISVE